jgi:DNA replication protein DnaC
MTDQMEETRIELKTIPVSYPEEFVGLINQGYAIPLVLPSVRDHEIPITHCQNCGGLGYVFVFVAKSGAKPYISPPLGKKAKWFPAGVFGERAGWVEGETKQGDCPVCGNGSTKTWLEKRCGLEGMDLKKSLETFSIYGEAAGKKPALELARSILSMNREACGIATFYGGYGCGKTHLLKSIVNGLRGVGLWSLYVTLDNLLRDIRSRFGDPNGQREVATVIEYYRSIRVLCLDEIDKANLTSWTMETIFALVDDRYTRKDQVLTVFASNTAPADLPAEMGYLASRMTEGNVIEVPGPDMRPAVKEIEDWTDK